MANVFRCPNCGGPVTKKDKSRYVCENPRCRVIFIERPYQQDRKIVYSAA